MAFEGGQSKLVADFSLKDLLDLHKKDILLNLNCHAIGTIVTFDPTTRTASVSINYKKTYYEPVTTTDTGVSLPYVPKLESYPVILECPVVNLYGGLAQLTFPIIPGDECLVLFNDRDINLWLTVGSSQLPPESQRLHALTDAIVLVGLLSNPKALAESYDPIRARLKYKLGGELAVGPQFVRIANELTTLNTLLQTLVTDIQTLVTQTALITVICNAPTTPSSPPINAPAIAAVAVQLASTAAQIATLLE